MSLSLLVLLTINWRICTITEKAPTRAFSWLKAPTSAFTFKTLLRHYAKRALTGLVSIVSYSRLSHIIIAMRTQFHVYLPWGQRSVLIVKALVGAFNQEKALVGAFSVIVQPVVEPMYRFAALVFTRLQGD